MAKKNYGDRIIRTTLEGCRVCGASVELHEGTMQGFSSDREFEIHIAEECGHEVRRHVLVTVPMSQATETYDSYKS